MVALLGKEILKVFELTFKNLILSSECSVIKLKLVILSVGFIKFEGHDIHLCLLLLAGSDLSIFVALLTYELHVICTAALFKRILVRPEAPACS